MISNRFIKTFFIFVFSVLFFACSGEKGPRYTLKKVELQKGDTLSVTMHDMGVSYNTINEISENLKKVFNPKKIRANDSYEIMVDTSSNWKYFKYFPGGLEYYEVEKSTTGIIKSAKKKRKIENKIVRKKGYISNSLWESMRKQGIEPDVILDFADIFAWQIDFLTEPREGDIYKVIYEMEVMDNGEPIRKTILGAQYQAKKEDHVAMLFTHENGKKGYYSPNGKSMMKAFLRAPLQFRRISSYFSNRRFHPILKYYRAHHGIDYAAPTGTPVSSIGDGVVIWKGWKNGYGNFIEIKHNNGYSSYYGHLSRYAKGLKKGKWVKQGQIVGYVGSTGVSTGPHLDFRIKKNGKFKNFLRLKIPPSKSLTKKERIEFKKIKKAIYTQFAELNWQKDNIAED
ncbi:peptidoglycan DD-metalloendopeptidase family protein [Elusimicrobiota bacterium]